MAAEIARAAPRRAGAAGAAVVEERHQVVPDNLGPQRLHELRSKLLQADYMYIPY